MNCIYCKESFDCELKKPIKLPCDHVFCESCAIFIKRKSYVCPVDNLRINIDIRNVDSQVLEKVKTLCKEHVRQSEGICLKHLVFYCEKCSLNHKNCEKVNNIEINAHKELIKLHDKALNNINELKKKFSETEVMFFRYFENYFEVKAMKGESEIDCQKMIESNACQIINLKNSALGIKDPVVPNVEELNISDILQEFKPENESGNSPLGEKSGMENSTYEMKMLENKLKSIQSSGKIPYRMCAVKEFQKEIQKEFIQDFVIKLTHCLKSEMIINKIAFGRPTSPEHYIFISNLQIYKIEKNGNKIDLFNKDLHQIYYDPESCTEEIESYNTIILKEEENLWFLMGIAAGSIYMGIPLENQSISLYQNDENEKLMNSPIIYLSS